MRTLLITYSLARAHTHTNARANRTDCGSMRLSYYYYYYSSAERKTIVLHRHKRNIVDSNNNIIIISSCPILGYNNHPIMSNILITDK